MEQIDKVKQIQEDLAEIFPETLTDDEIIDNKKVFFYNGKTYRVRMPNQKELFLANLEQQKYKVSLLQNGIITKKKLVKLLKDQDVIDIEELEKDKQEIENKLIAKSVELGPSYSDEEKKIEQLKQEISTIELEHQNICAKIINHLEPCLEYQVDTFYYNLLTSMCTEIEESEDVWNKKWKNYAEFENEDPGFIKTCITWFCRLYHKVRNY